MKDVLLTSSVLIGALLILRLLFRRVIARRVQYALWLLVAVRLLVPVSLPAADFSVLTAAEPVSRQITAPSLYMEPVQEDVEGPADLPALDKTPSDYSQVAIGGATKDNTRVFTDEKNVTHTVEYARQIHLTDILAPAWYAGIAVMLFWMLVSNLRFWQMLRRKRVPYEVQDCLYPVYLVKEGLSSPCLFGLVSPAIYLTPAAVETPERLRHVIAHENAHARHLDHLWALVRSVCLAVYWFDPLVWAAAAASKADGELACDEAALKRLGDAERLPYGRTLLALIPVGDRAPTPLLSTSMTAGKRQLKDRILRIAQNRRTVTAALFAVIALTAGVCAVTFTGGKTSPQTEEPRPLTGEELAYFNEEYFNGDDFNIRNQFLSSLYTSPEEINLFSLFYDGTGLPEEITDAERQAVANARYGGSDPGTDLIKISAANADAILEANTGLTLSETQRVDLDAFTYLPEYDAYYTFHGDTNYPGTVVFSAGEQEGDRIRLYCPDSRFGNPGGTNCLTLAVQPDGSYWFVSYLFSEPAAIPTVYPEGDPWLTISLTDLSPYEPETPQAVRHTDDRTEEYLLTGVYDDSLVLYRSTDGNLYAAVENEIVSDESGIVTWDVGCFFTFPAGTAFSDVTVTSFYDLLGHDGMAFSYYGEQGDYTTSLITDYWYLDEDGVPCLLARARGETAMVDLDGNGENELLTDQNQLFFQREGSLYAADITALLEANWPEMTWWDYSLIDTSRRCLTISGFARETNAPADSETQFNFVRYCYFDGENLLFYDDTTTYTDHVSDSIDAPDYALTAARDRVLADLAGWQARSDSTAGWDDWRITGLSSVDLGEPYTSLGLEVYSFGYELHAAAPEHVILAGGMYVLEDGWVGGMNSSPYLVFLRQSNGTSVLLNADIPGDVGADMAIPAFQAAIAQITMDNGLLLPSRMDPETILNLFCVNSFAFLDSLSNLPETEQSAAIEALASFHNQGLLEEEGNLRHTMQNIAWSQGSLSEGGAAVWRALLSRTGIQPNGIGDSYDRLDDAILNAILDHRASASGHQDDFYAASYTTLDSVQSGNTRTEYLLTCFGSYDLSDDGSSYTLETGGIEPAALTFATINGLYQLTEYWTPTAGNRYAADLRRVFPEEAAQAALSPSAETRSGLERRREQRAQEQFAALQAAAPQEPEAAAFTAADVEFSNQPLDGSADSMTYEERLAWAQDTALPETVDLISTGTYREEAGCLAILGQWVGTPHTDQYNLLLRLPDGTLANLPLPSSNPVNVAPPDTMAFSGGTFVYTINFPEDFVFYDSQTLLHLAGTYRYTVDLAAKTVSLTVTNP